MRARSHIRWLVALLSIAVPAAICPSASAAYDQSTASGVTTGHTGFASGGSLERPPLTVRWSRDLNTYTSYPVIADGRVFVVTSATAAPAVVALDGATGATLWERGLTATGHLAYDAGRVFVSGRYGKVTALAAATGEPLWERSLPEPFQLNTPVADGGVLYVDSAWSGGNVYALAGTDGETLWQSPAHYGGGPALSGAFAFQFGDLDSGTLAFSRGDGRRAWVGDATRCAGRAEVAVDGARIIGPYAGSCGAIHDAATGHALGTLRSDYAPAVAGDVVVTVGDDAHAVRAHSLSSGAALWTREPASQIAAPPIVVNETVYVSTFAGDLLATDLRSGDPLWAGTVPGVTFGESRPAMAAGGGMLVASADTVVTAFGSVAGPRPGLDLRIAGGPEGPTRETTASFDLLSTGVLSTFCRLDAGAWSACGPSVAHSGLADGPHVLEVQTRELVGGAVVALASRGWSVDTVAPTARITAGPDALVGTREARFVIAVDDSAPRTSCRLDGGAWSRCESPVGYAGLSHGPHHLDVRAEDAVGNVQATPATWDWVVDVVSPVTTITSGPSGTVAADTATFAFGADEPATFECQLDLGGFAPCASPVAYGPLTAGPHRFDVLATDAAGRREIPFTSRAFTIAGAIPAPPPVAPGGPVAPRPAGSRADAGQPPASRRAHARSVARTTATALKRSLRRALRGTVRVTLVAREPGTIAIDVRTKARPGGRATVVARMQATFARSGRRAVVLRLTPAGRRLLRRSARLSLVVRAAIRPTRGVAASAEAAARI